MLKAHYNFNNKGSKVFSVFTCNEHRKYMGITQGTWGGFEK